MLTLKKVRERIQELDLGPQSAIVEVGSCSRGEESYFINDYGERELLSDYEVLAVIGRGEDRTHLELQLSAIGEELKQDSNSPFFSFDYAFTPRWKLPLLDKRLIHFETREAASVVIGDKDVVFEFPTINLGNLNYSELASVVNHRLYHVIKDYASVSDRKKKYLIARNTLDIPTVVLPYFGKLICGYRERNAAMRGLEGSLPFAPGFEQRLERSLKMKLDFDSDLYAIVDSEELLDCFISDMRNLHDFLACRNGGECFIRPRRRVISSLFRFSPGGVKLALSFPMEEENIYQSMVDKLSCRSFNKEYLGRLANKINRLYGYR